MTKKRFVPSIDESCIIDNLKNKSLYSVVDTVECLNHLHEENTRLKNKLKFLNELNKPYGVIIEENTRLKKQINELKKGEMRND